MAQKFPIRITLSASISLVLDTQERFEEYPNSLHVVPEVMVMKKKFIDEVRKALDPLFKKGYVLSASLAAWGLLL